MNQVAGAGPAAMLSGAALQELDTRWPVKVDQLLRAQLLAMSMV